MDTRPFEADVDPAIAADLAALAGAVAVAIADLPSGEAEGRRSAIAAAANRVLGDAIARGKAADHHPVAFGSV